MAPSKKSRGKAAPIKMKVASPKSSVKSATKTARLNNENVVRLGTDAVKEMFSTSSGEARKAQNKAYAIGREGAQHMSRSADAATRAMSEAVSVTQNTIEACIESGNITATMSREISEEIFNFANEIMSNNIDISKDVFSCRTINDVFELQSKMFRNNVDRLFNESAKISEMVFDTVTKASEPLSERMVEASDKLSKSFAA